MTLDRHLAIPLRRAAQSGEPVLLQGPRGAGKTLLVRREFPDHRYVTLEEAEDRMRARRDPAVFIARLRGQPAVIDDAHRAPELLRHLAGVVATPPRQPPLVLVSARRVAIEGASAFELHGPTRAELERRPPMALDVLGRYPQPPRLPANPAGAWPASPRRFIELDARDMVNVHDVDRFEEFVGLARARSGDVLDQQALAREAGLAHRTVVRWLAVLDACFVTLSLAAAGEGFGRRITRRRKLHFLEGLPPGRFESEVVSEIYRNARHAGLDPDLRYWRDSNGLEMPLLIGSETMPPVPVAIAAAPTPVDEARLRRWMELARVERGAVISRSERGAGERRDGRVLRYAIGQL